MADLESGFERRRGIPIEKVLADLVTRAADIKNFPQEYVVEGDIRATDLRPLVGLPFETTITVLGRKFVLSTGAEDHMYGNPDRKTNARETGSPLWFHAHQVRKGVVFNAPSLYDLRTAVLRSTNPRLSNPIIAHRDGLQVFAVRQGQLEIALADMGQWLEAHRALRDEPEGPTEASLELEAAMSRELAEKVSAVTFETTWENKAGVERVMRTFASAIE